MLLYAVVKHLVPLPDPWDASLDITIPCPNMVTVNHYGPKGFFGKGKFHVLEAPEKSKNDMEVLRPVLSTSRRGAFNAVEKKQ